ncbi:hypothetical protein F4780DRAFT_778864 [Xylariomycetidae sp. FL0641]|nr:hypothetical protein F4780DRAFT_778864 [Xylariomycetidae sp. FL0641]
MLSRALARPVMARRATTTTIAAAPVRQTWASHPPPPPSSRRLLRNHSNFTPPPQLTPSPSPYPYPYPPPPPRSRWARARDMALGSALTVLAALGYAAWEARRQLAALRAREREYREMAARLAEWERSLRRARLAGDRDAARALVFARARYLLVELADDDEADAADDADAGLREAGPLPRFPAGHPRHGTDTVAPEDTLVFARARDVAGEGEEEGSSPPFRVFDPRGGEEEEPGGGEVGVWIAVNQRIEPSTRPFSLDGPGAYTPEQELIARCMAPTWRSEGPDAVRLAVIGLFTQDAVYAYVYQDGTVFCTPTTYEDLFDRPEVIYE